MTELDRNVLINRRAGKLGKPFVYELWIVLTMNFRVEKVNGITYFCIFENGHWFALEDSELFCHYAKTLEGAV